MISGGKLINPEVRIENTNLCNANCIICNHSKMKRPKATMPPGHFNSIVSKTKELGAKTISIFGYGEPLIDTYLPQRIKYCTYNKLETFITTNAGLLDERMAEKLLDAGLSHIRFSVHGIGETYEKVHRGLKYDTVKANIDNFIKMSASICRISVTVIPLHNESIDQIRGIWEDKVDWLEIWKPHNWGGKESFRKLAGKEMKSCGRPFSGPLQIQADGNVIPCCFLTDAEIVLGNTYRNTIEEILKGERYEELREKHRTSVKGLPCEGCEQRFIPDQNPLLYSSRDPSREIGKTSSTKFKIIGD